MNYNNYLTLFEPICSLDNFIPPNIIPIPYTNSSSALNSVGSALRSYHSVSDSKSKQT